MKIRFSLFAASALALAISAFAEDVHPTWTKVKDNTYKNTDEIQLSFVQYSKVSGGVDIMIHAGSFSKQGSVTTVDLTNLGEAMSEDGETVVGFSVPGDQWSRDALHENNWTTKLVLPTSIRYLGARSFANWTQLREIVNLELVDKIEDDAFYKDPLDKGTVTINASEIAGKEQFMSTKIGSLKIGERVTELPTLICRNCTSLTNLDLTAARSLQTIGDNAFDGCTNLKTIAGAFPESLQEIKPGAFKDSKTLASPLTFHNVSPQSGQFAGTKVSAVTIGTGVTEIAEAVFSNCTALTSLAFADDCRLGEIGAFAFAGSGLAALACPSSLVTIGYAAFSNCASLATLDLGNVQTLDTDLYGFADTFAGCSALATVTVGDSLQVIPKRAFASCGATKVELLGPSLRDLEDEAFANCTQLASVTNAATRLNLFGAAFSNCTALTSVYWAGSMPVRVSENAFGGLPNGQVTIYVNAPEWSRKRTEDGYEPPRLVTLTSSSGSVPELGQWHFSDTAHQKTSNSSPMAAIEGLHPIRISGYTRDIKISSEWTSRNFPGRTGAELDHALTNRVNGGYLGWQYYVLGMDVTNQFLITSKQTADPDNVCIVALGVGERPEDCLVGRMFQLEMCRDIHAANPVWEQKGGAQEEAEMLAPLADLTDEQPVSYYKVKAHFMSEDAVCSIDLGSYVTAYTGEAQTLPAPVLFPKDMKVLYSTDRETWTEELPTMTDVGEMTVYAKGSATGFKDGTVEAKLTITRAKNYWLTHPAFEGGVNGWLSADGEPKGTFAPGEAKFGDAAATLVTRNLAGEIVEPDPVAGIPKTRGAYVVTREVPDTANYEGVSSETFYSVDTYFFFGTDGAGGSEEYSSFNRTQSFDTQKKSDASEKAGTKWHGWGRMIREDVTTTMMNENETVAKGCLEESHEVSSQYDYYIGYYSTSPVDDKNRSMRTPDDGVAERTFQGNSLTIGRKGGLNLRSTTQCTITFKRLVFLPGNSGVYIGIAGFPKFTLAGKMELQGLTRFEFDSNERYLRVDSVVSGSGDIACFMRGSKDKPGYFALTGDMSAYTGQICNYTESTEKDLHLWLGNKFAGTVKDLPPGLLQFNIGSNAAVRDDAKGICGIKAASFSSLPPAKVYLRNFSSWDTNTNNQKWAPTQQVPLISYPASENVDATKFTNLSAVTLSVETLEIGGEMRKVLMAAPKP